MQFLSNLLSTIRSWVGLILPVFSTAADFRHWNPWVWRMLHLVLVAAVLVLLWWLNHIFGVPVFLKEVPLSLQPYYLPALGVLVWAVVWLAYWFGRLLGEDQGAAEFPDVDAAWTEAVRKLDSAGIGVADAPLFLILGRPEGGEDALFQAGKVGTTVRAPSADGVPLRVYAHRDAIFVTCAGASAWGRFAALLAGAGGGDGGSVPATAAVASTNIFGEGLSDEEKDEMGNLLTGVSSAP